MQKVLIIVSVLALGACSITRETPAPIVNVTTPRVQLQPTTPLPAVAPATPAPTATTITKINNSDEAVITDQPVSSPAFPVTPKATGASTAIISLAGQEWQRPIAGKIVQGFTAATKGVDVAAKEGTPIVAAAAGKVVYSGNGLKGYGNLIIVKHSNHFLTAYAHNRFNLVKENTMVKRGQKIAEVGKTEAATPMLHFELRKSGNPLDPSLLFSAEQAN